MRILHVCLCLLVLNGCVSRPTAPPDPRPYALRVEQSPLALPPNSPPELEFSDAQALLPRLEALYPQIGGWPPRYQSEAERQQIYRQWVQMLQVARVLLAQENNSEPSRYVLAELYRIGHNMDVKGAAEEAQRQIHACLKSYPQSMACHFSSIRYYLAVAPLQLELAETSLTYLRGAFSPEFNEEVERGFVFLSLYRRDHIQARRQIEDFLALFPESPFRADFETIRERLIKGEPIRVPGAGD